MCLRWMPSNCAGSAGERGAGPLVQGIGLELDSPAAEHLERVLELEQLRLRVGAGAPGRRCEPRPPDLEAPVLRSQRQEPRRADRASRSRRSTVANARSSPASTRASASSIQACQSSRVCGWTIGSQRQIARVPRRLVEVVGVLAGERLEPHDPALERRCRPSLHARGTVHSGHADLRVRVHGVRGPLRRARPQRRPGGRAARRATRPTC